MLTEAAESRTTRGHGAGAQRGAAMIEIHTDGYTDAAGEELEAAAASYGELGCGSTRPAPCSPWAAHSGGPRSGVRPGRARARAGRLRRDGSPGWADAVRAELERTGARRPAAAGGLTATEQPGRRPGRRGLANKEIARTLVVTVNTVEFHLRNTYAKLGSAPASSWRPPSRELGAHGTDPADLGSPTDFLGSSVVSGPPPAASRVRAMTEYLVELYVAQGDHRVAQQQAERARRASAELTLAGRHVRCLRSIFVPEDETCFLLYEAYSADMVAEAYVPRRAPLRAHLGRDVQHGPRARPVAW